MRYILTLLLLSAAMLRTAAQENYTLADTLTLDAVVVTGVTLTSGEIHKMPAWQDVPMGRKYELMEQAFIDIVIIAY